ncbi:MAG: YIP1 family protein [Candidatus Bathyarchaeota archaeon]|nr:YIP1 family protein [Candidatus Bathyarchaeota archaeon]
MDLSGVVPSDDRVKQIIIFVYGLSIVSFLGGSQIPAIFLRKRSFIVQFGFSITFGFMLLLITILNDTTLNPLNETILKPFFLNYPVIAAEYLSIPYFFMIFIDLYLSGRLSAFSWGHFRRFFGGTFLHPRRTFEEVSYDQSILFSLVSVVLISVAWIVRTVVFSLADFVPTRWSFVPFSIGEPLELVSRTVLIIPAALLFWLIMSVLVHVAARQLGGTSSHSRIASLLGFVFLPSLITIAVDLLEIGLQIENSLLLNVIFLIFGFVIPLVLWPLILVIFAVRTSEMLSWRSTSLAAIIGFLPLFILLTFAFL